MDFPFKVSDMNAEEAKQLEKKFQGLPDKFVRIEPEGFVYYKFENFMEQLSFIYNLKIRKSDTFVTSLPRSGNTMTQELVWLIGNDLDYETASSKHLCERYIWLWVKSVLKTTELQEHQQRKCKHIKKLQRVRWPFEINADSDDRRYIMSHMPLCLLPPDTLDIAKVVYVARNPLDVAVSMFHFNRTLKSFEFVGDFRTFWRLFYKDLIKFTPYFAHVKQAWERRNHPNMLFLFYEDYAKDLPAAIRRISTFLNKSYSHEQIKGLCEHMKFENFQKNQSVNIDFLKEFDLVVPDEQPFIRRGKTGGWRDYFDAEMRKQAAGWIKDNLSDTDLRFPELDDLLKANY